MLEKISPEAINRLANALRSKDERNALRAAEITLSHTVPKLEEVDTSANPYSGQSLPVLAQVDAIISRAIGATAPMDQIGDGGSQE